MLGVKCDDNVRGKLFAVNWNFHFKGKDIIRCIFNGFQAKKKQKKSKKDNGTAVFGMWLSLTGRPEFCYVFFWFFFLSFTEFFLFFYPIRDAAGDAFRVTYQVGSLLFVFRFFFHVFFLCGGEVTPECARLTPGGRFSFVFFFLHFRDFTRMQQKKNCDNGVVHSERWEIIWKFKDDAINPISTRS